MSGVGRAAAARRAPSVRSDLGPDRSVGTVGGRAELVGADTSSGRYDCHHGVDSAPVSGLAPCPAQLRVMRYFMSCTHTCSGGLAVAISTALLASFAQAEQPQSIAQVGQNWPFYGGDHNAQRFSPLKQITPQNVGRLARLVARRQPGLQSLSGRPFAIR
ncbi:hypothetical protein D3C80_1022240 [compost metagenome]